MSGFNTKAKNDFGEYEITFFTKSKDEYEEIQALCREIIDRNGNKKTD